MSIKTNLDLVEKCIDIAKNYKTLYVMGGIGYRLTEANKTRAINNGAHGSYNAKSTRKKMIQAADADTWAFDCVCLIKSVLWGWQGDKTKKYGGATYVSNNVPDIDADSMINVCKEVSTDFSKIEVGEAVWCKGHIGVYIGGGLAVECTPAWKNCVQITACNKDVIGYNRRNWTKHGKLPYITYVKEETHVKPETTTLTLDEVVKRVINGVYGNGSERKERIPKETPYTYNEVQAAVNTYLNHGAIVKYYPKYSGKSNSIVDILKSINVNSSYSYRCKIAKANGISLYIGSAKQNTKLVTLAKSGLLIKV